MIVCVSHGICKIAAVEDNASAGPCFILSFGNQLKVIVPVAQAPRLIRKLASREEAEQDLETLRGACPPPATRRPSELRQERERILRTGTRTERTACLRVMYAASAPASDSALKAIYAFEDLVLAEIATALDIPRSELEGEMRTRYPNLIKKSNKKPVEHR